MPPSFQSGAPWHEVPFVVHRAQEVADYTAGKLETCKDVQGPWTSLLEIETVLIGSKTFVTVLWASWKSSVISPLKTLLVFVPSRGKYRVSYIAHIFVVTT